MCCRRQMWPKFHELVLMGATASVWEGRCNWTMSGEYEAEFRRQSQIWAENNCIYGTSLGLKFFAIGKMLFFLLLVKGFQVL